MKHNTITLEKCPLCGHDSFDKERTVKDFSTSKEDFKICKCQKCSLLFTNPRPSAESIGRYYESQNYISHTNQKTGLFGSLYQVLRKKALSKKMGWISKHKTSGHLLDFGCGTGEFLNHCQKNGWQVTGFEIADGPREMAIKNYGLPVFSPEKFGDVNSQSQDVITLWHVLEHLPDLKSITNQLVDKLKKGGVLVLALPNANSWDAKFYQEYWAAWDVPIHYYHFTKNNIELLAKTSGLELIETVNMPFDSYYVSLLSEEYKTGKKNWFKATINGFKSKLKGKEGNASSLTYVLRKL